MRSLVSAAALAAAAVAVPASANTVIIDPISAAFSNATGGAGVVIFAPGASTSINWGTGGTSGYDFAAATTPLNVPVVVNGVSSPFALGDFTHRNQPIGSGSGITGVRLTITYGVALDDGMNPVVPIGNFNAVFDVDHWETPNAADPCADGGANGVGVNVNGCADRVKISLNTGLTQFFKVDGISYTLNISGFEIGGNPTDVFWTTERADNKASLIGTIVARSVIPEPATWAMMILGFGMVGMGLRRRNSLARVEA